MYVNVCKMYNLIVKGLMERRTCSPARHWARWPCSGWGSRRWTRPWRWWGRWAHGSAASSSQCPSAEWGNRTWRRFVSTAAEPNCTFVCICNAEKRLLRGKSTHTVSIALPSSANPPIRLWCLLLLRFLFFPLPLSPPLPQIPHQPPPRFFWDIW